MTSSKSKSSFSNYESSSHKTKLIVKLQKTDDFDVLDSKSGSSCEMAPANNFEKEIDIVRDGFTKTYFFIKPKKAGILKIAASAQLNMQFGHSTSQNIFIEETGLKEGKVKAKIFDLRKQGHDSIFFNMGLNDEAVDASEKLEAFVSGNFMGSGREIAM